MFYNKLCVAFNCETFGLYSQWQKLKLSNITLLFLGHCAFCACHSPATLDHQHKKSILSLVREVTCTEALSENRRCSHHLQVAKRNYAEMGPI